MNSPEFPRRYTRREWLKTGAFTAAAAASAGRAVAAESHGKWTDESEAKYTQKLFDWLKADFAKRVRTLATEGGLQFALEYDYMKPTDDRRRTRVFEKFAEGSLTSVATTKHIEACLQEFERLRVALAAKEAVAAENWKAKMAPVIARDGAIFDTRVSAERLTVVLDNSPSMLPYLPKLRAEISKDFNEAFYAEVSGCQLTRPPEVPWFFCAPSPLCNPFAPDRHIPKVPTLNDKPHSTFIRWTRDAPAALVCMIDLMKTDAIYWFCDFDDPTLDSVIKQIAPKLLTAKTALYIHTLDRKPPRLLAELAEASGGAVVRKRI